MIYIGIDPGVNTGVAIIIDGKFKSIMTYSILGAMRAIDQIEKDSPSEVINLYIENPNLRTYFGKSSRELLQGAGSIKRDFSIWKEYAEYNAHQIVEVHPKNVGSSFDKTEIFKAATGWEGRTSKHARDAAKLVYKHFKK